MTTLIVSGKKIKIPLYKIKTKKVNQKIRLLLITDLHSCLYGKEQINLLTEIDNIKPDVILLGGDIVDEDLPKINATILLKYISKKYQCLYVSGNHETYNGDLDDVKKLVKSCGITILEGDCKEVIVNNEIINVCGVDDPSIGQIKMFNQVEKSYNKADKKYYTLLLTHRPEYIYYYLNYDFDLILSGHAHGGQWRIPGILNGLYAPGQGLFPHYAGGHYKFNNKNFIVSRGLSKEKVLVPRFFNPPELVVVEVEPDC